MLHNVAAANANGDQLASEGENEHRGAESGRCPKVVIIARNKPGSTHDAGVVLSSLTRSPAPFTHYIFASLTFITLAAYPVSIARGPDS